MSEALDLKVWEVVSIVDGIVETAVSKWVKEWVDMVLFRRVGIIGRRGRRERVWNVVRRDIVSFFLAFVHLTILWRRLDLRRLRDIMAMRWGEERRGNDPIYVSIFFGRRSSVEVLERTANGMLHMGCGVCRV